jgi:hypothetical protein
VFCKSFDNFFFFSYQLGPPDFRFSILSETIDASHIFGYGFVHRKTSLYTEQHCSRTRHTVLLLAGCEDAVIQFQWWKTTHPLLLETLRAYLAKILIKQKTRRPEDVDSEKKYIVTCKGYEWLIDGFWVGCLDLLTPYTLVTTRDTALSLIYTL